LEKAMVGLAAMGAEVEGMQEPAAVRLGWGVSGSGLSAAALAKNRERFERQLKLRRGPTPEMFFVKHIDNTRLEKSDDPARKAEMRRFATVGVLFFALVFVYVMQHFWAIQLGYNVEAQKKAVEQLREENRQLRLTDAVLTDPQRIDSLAKQLGMAEPAPGQVIRQDAGDGAVVAEMKRQEVGSRK
jgi:cell division protein FtsL